MVVFGKLNCNQCPTVQGDVHALTKMQTKRNRGEEIIHSWPYNNTAAKGKNEHEFFDHQLSVPYAAPCTVPCEVCKSFIYLYALHHHDARKPHKLYSYLAPRK